MRTLLASSLIAAAAAAAVGGAAGLAMSAEAGDRRADIDYYTSGYDGADIALARFHCGAAGAQHTAAEREAWLSCYMRFAENYKAALPVGRSIPAEVAEQMSDAELAAAQQLMSRVFVRIADEARQQADLVLLAQGESAAVLSARSASGLLPGLPAQTRPLRDRP